MNKGLELDLKKPDKKQIKRCKVQGWKNGLMSNYKTMQVGRNVFAAGLQAGCNL